MRLKNLPKGTSVALQIQTSGKLRIIVVDSAELRRFPATRALFEGVADTRIGVSVVIPRSADYYVVFDNRPSDEVRSVQMKIQARAPRRKAPKRHRAVAATTDPDASDVSDPSTPSP